jgi:hypothetical protein
MLGASRVNYDSAGRELLAGMVSRRVMGVSEKENSVLALRDCRMNDTGQ